MKCILAISGDPIYAYYPALIQVKQGQHPNKASFREIATIATRQLLSQG